MGRLLKPGGTRNCWRAGAAYQMLHQLGFGSHDSSPSAVPPGVADIVGQPAQVQPQTTA